MQRFTLIIGLAVFIFSCGNAKEIEKGVNDSKEMVEETIEDKMEEKDEAIENAQKGAMTKQAIVRDKSADGCGFILEIEGANEKLMLEPLELSKEFQEDGKIVNVSYRMSRRASKCLSALPIVIDNIK